ncbi:MAG: YggS family pyridoxal phosphate-dependent enzyme [Ruminococcaceae bacterium]|nr:YggS family pyridoxal phosphate-dependent enzyme [Oscillospiraceae bacterium]
MEKSSISFLETNYNDIKSRFDAAVKKSGRKDGEVILLAATKTVAPEIINEAIKLGITHIGENRVQEFLSKNDEVTKNVTRHFIGHLQTNKVKDIVGKVSMIESVHSLKLAREIGKCSEKIGTVTDVLIEINIGGEESKSGFSPDEIDAAIDEMSAIRGIRIRGLMCIPPICEKSEQVKEYFNRMRKLFVDIGLKKRDNVTMEFLSMGMSSDFEDAIECGSNLVRVGTALFGKRN